MIESTRKISDWKINEQEMVPTTNYRLPTADTFQSTANISMPYEI